MIKNVINLIVSDISTLMHISWNMMNLKFHESFSSLYFVSSEYILAKLNKTRSWFFDVFKTWGFEDTEKIQNEISSNKNDWCCSNDCIWDCWNWTFCWCCFFVCCRCRFVCCSDWFSFWYFDCFDCSFDCCDETFRFWCRDEFDNDKKLIRRSLFRSNVFALI